jgi:serine/threonine protein kinase
MPFDDKNKLSTTEIRANQPAKTRESLDAQVATSVLPEGTIIAGQYKVLSLLGSGGMSQVYRCQDLSLDRQVAVKLLLLHTSINSQAVLRFQREGKAIAMLNHENIVKVYALQVFNDQQPVMVMEVVNGISLADLVEGGKQLPLPRVLKFVSQICDALTHAHSLGVIHRDLKPSNIMLVNPGQTNERIKILDFGIAKIVADDSIKATQTGDVFGSPAYMSPEQAEGKSINAKTDQYSLGCVVFELLTGRPPFIGSNQISVIVAHLQDQPPPLSQFCKKTIPSDIEKTVMRLLAKDPEKRFASITEVKDAFFPDPSKLSSTKHWQFVLTSGKGIAVAVSALALIGAAAIALLLTGEHSKQAPPPPPRIFNEVAESKVALDWTGNQNPDDLNLINQINSGKQDVNVANSHVTDAGMLRLHCLPSLNSLNLDGCRYITDTGIRHLEHVAISELSVSDTSITNKSMPVIGAMHSLTGLNLHLVGIDDDGLADLKELVGLKSLYLTENIKISGRGLNSLAGMTVLDNLYLDKLYNIHGELESIEKLKSISTLSLLSCHLDNADLVHIIPLKKISSLILDENQINDHGLEALTKLPRLRYLSLVGCPVTEAGVRAFLAVHPRTTVTYGHEKHFKHTLGPLR